MLTLAHFRVDNGKVLVRAVSGSKWEIASLGQCATYASLLRDLVHFLGSRAVHAYDGLQDEGDRCYLESTNHADMLLQSKTMYDAYRFDTDDAGPVDALVKTAS